jgi:hypothetical protein
MYPLLLIRILYLETLPSRVLLVLSKYLKSFYLKINLVKFNLKLSYEVRVDSQASVYF